MATTAIAGGIGVLALVLLATVLSVTFATRGAMATNRPIVEVLHFIGAKNGFIAGHFQRHFLLLGLKGGAIGGGARWCCSGWPTSPTAGFLGPAARRQSRPCSAPFSIGLAGYVGGAGPDRPDRRW